MAIEWIPVAVDGNPRGGGGFRGFVNGVRIFTLVHRENGMGWVLRHVLPWPDVPVVEYHQLRRAQAKADEIVEAYEDLVGRPVNERDVPIEVRPVDRRDPL